MSENGPDPAAPFSAAFWQAAWDGLGDAFLADSQRRHPHRWRRFYDSHGHLLRTMSGLDLRQGQAVVTLLWQQGLASARSTVVDLGCGTGWLALPLALRGARVVAVDTSSRILEALGHRVARMGVHTLEMQHTCWTRMRVTEPYDLALAACFPPALCPAGVTRMESLGRRCALLVSAQDTGFFWVKNLWLAVCGHFPFSGGRHLQAALNYLMANQRRPNLLSIRLSRRIDIPLEQAIDFYSAYFSLFDCTGPRVTAAIEREMAPFAGRRRLKAAGEVCSGLIWWER